MTSELNWDWHCLTGAGAKIVFLQFRQQTQTLQGVMVVSGEKDEHQVSKQMLKFAQGIPVGLLIHRYHHLSDLTPQSESLVTVEGVIKEAEVKSCTIQTYEVGIHKLYTTVEAGALPFSMEDASRPESDFQKVRPNPLGYNSTIPDTT